jgi:DDE superfamily endonuclease
MNFDDDDSSEIPYNFFFRKIRKESEDNSSESDCDGKFFFQLKKRRKLIKKVAAVAAVYSLTEDRHPSFARERHAWERFAADLMEENAFRRYYRMEKDSFLKLISFIRPIFSLNEEMSHRCTNGNHPIGIEMILHCTLRYLAGSSGDDIRIACGISLSSFYRSIHQGVSLILACKALDMIFPSSLEEYEEAADAFKSVSRNEVMKGCVGALDGWLCRIETPSAKETSIARAFHSGHYNTEGLNVQACCDSKCRFIHVSINSPGSTNDIVAYAESSLSETVCNLPFGKYIVADNAYINSNFLLTPYSGQHKNDVAKDTFNFYWSQCRIRIEQAFGQLTNVWRIFKKPMRLDLENVPRFILAAMRLHNYLIDERQVGFDNNDTQQTIRTLSDEEILIHSRNYESIVPPVEIMQRRHTIREIILNEIKSDGLQRPIYNRQRNINNRNSNNN